MPSRFSTHQKFWPAGVVFAFQIKTLPKFSPKYESGNLTRKKAAHQQLAAVQNTLLWSIEKQIKETLCLQGITASFCGVSYICRINILEIEIEIEERGSS